MAWFTNDSLEECWIGDHVLCYPQKPPQSKYVAKSDFMTIVDTVDLTTVMDRIG